MPVPIAATTKPTSLFAVCLLLFACGDGDVGEAGGGADASVAQDGGVGCREDGDCNDGIHCNGAERCAPDDALADTRGCVSEQRVLCDDGVACTVDRCSEAVATCVHEAPDVDGDGHADAQCVDTDGLSLGDDCDDGDARRFPGAVEFCDDEGIDEDCDPESFGDRDIDDDGYLDARCCNGERCGDDCDDLHGPVHPNAAELCDHLDNDCDGATDETVQLARYVDADHDGFGAPGEPIDACPGDVGVAEVGGDCDDADVARNPGQVEICDGLDNDCDADVDEAFNEVPWYLDADADGFGDGSADVVVACQPPIGRALRAGDCDDRDATVGPGQPERCNAVDDDCNGLADFQVGTNDFEDDDGDGYADGQCGGDDCDDRDLASGDDATAEICDGRDNDCDGSIDEDALEQIWFRDGDGDGYGSLLRGVLSSCTPVDGYVTRGGDCDDEDATRSPAAREACDGVDQDCDGSVDERTPDADGDGLCDARDACLGARTSPDADADGVCDDTDLCPGQHDDLAQPVVNGSFETGEAWVTTPDTRLQSGQPGHLTPGRGWAGADCSTPATFTQSLCMPRTPVPAPAMLGGYIAHQGSVFAGDYFRVALGGSEVYRGYVPGLFGPGQEYRRWSVCLLPEELAPGPVDLVLDVAQVCGNAAIFVDDVSIETAAPTECAAPGTVTHGDFEQDGGFRTDQGALPLEPDPDGGRLLHMAVDACDVSPTRVTGLLYTPSAAVLSHPALRLRVRGDAGQPPSGLIVEISSRRGATERIGDLADVGAQWADYTFCIPATHQYAPGEVLLEVDCEAGPQEYYVDDLRLVSDPVACP